MFPMGLKVYTASCLHHRAMWRELAEQWTPDVEFCAGWIRLEDDVFAMNENDPKALLEHWLRDSREIAQCDVVMVNAAVSDKLRGALVEAGMGLAHGKPVLVIGTHPDYGTWQHHPG